MRRLTLIAVTLLALAQAPHSASASVIYRIEEFPKTGGADTFDATLTVTDFVTAATTFPIASLSVVTNTFPYVSVFFSPNISAASCSGFNISTACDGVYLITAGGSGNILALANGALANPGTYLDSFGVAAGRLTVTDTNAPVNAVPEPATLALVAAGVLALGAVRRRIATGRTQT